MNKEFKVGDRVRIDQNTCEKYMRSGQVDGSNPCDIEGVVQGVFPYKDELTHWVQWDNNTSNSYSPIHLMLVTPAPSSLRLEECYTVAPQKALRKVIAQAAEEFNNPKYLDVIVRDTNPIIFWDVDIKGLNAYHDIQALARTYPNHKEVSIPEFLTLIEQYGNRKADPVKVVLNENITAFVEEGQEVVKLVYSGQDLTVTRTELRDFQEALKGSGHCLKRGDYVETQHPSVKKALMEILGNCTTGSGWSDNAYPQIMAYESGTVFCGNTSIFSHIEGQTKLTLEEFLAKCTGKPLPQLAGYTAKKVKEGEVYYDTKKAPSEGFGFGCQFIPLTAFEALVKAVA